MRHGRDVDLYRVGLLYDVWLLWRHYVTRNHPQVIGRRRPWRRFFRMVRRGLLGQYRVGGTRAVRNYFRGWLAESSEGSCGWGWTQRAALRRLERLQQEGR